MPGAFCLKDARYCLLTYSQTPPDFDYENILTLLTSLGAECIISRENHEDGGIHYHAFVHFGRKFSTRRADIFDVTGRHPNIEKVGRTPWLAFDYVLKDGDVVAGGAERPEESTRGGDKQSTWAWIMEAETRDQFLDRIRSEDPRALACNYPSITKYADYAYRKTPSVYESPAHYSWKLDDYPGIEEWVNTNLKGDLER